MKKSIITLTALLTLAFAPLYASEKTSTNIYQCVNNTTLEQDPDCVANLIDQGAALQKQLTAINQDAAEFNHDMVMAVMKFDPKLKTIDIVAISDEKPTESAPTEDSKL
ncbi:hypothetical protein [Gayadomonas joobiniege]|uniref:hypothetical protein n=1 Tax=Gayadomonas joobiniege TaxID=1234606 RepID=UPI00036E7993|nr:hypothetical protein [Gayadomonas joobiniege]